MQNLLSTANPRNIGILVLGEFMALEELDFIEFVGQSKANDAYIHWRDPAARREGGFSTLAGQCGMVIQGKHIALHLFLIPPSLPTNFNLTDWIPPVEISGCLLIANRHFGYESWNQISTDPRKRLKNIRISRLAWIKAQKTPFLIAATGQEPLPALTVEQLRECLDLEPQMPIWEIPSQYTVEHEYTYDLNEAKRVLAVLAENIIVNKP